MVKLTEKELNKLFYDISNDNEVYALIFKLTYVYARKIGEVLKLRASDVSLKHNSIDFNIPKGSVGFVLDKNVKDLLINHIHSNNLEGDDLLFIEEDFNLNYYSKKLNTYLHNFIHNLNKKGYDLPIIVCTDLRVLRGQHLFLNGVNVNLIHELYGNTYLHSTRKLLNYHELMELKFPCKRFDNIFSEYTDLNRFSDVSFKNVDVYRVQCDYGEVVFGFMDGEFEYIKGSKELYDELVSMSCFKEFILNCERLDIGDYSLFEGFKVLKD